jgi:hypothetical protein
VQNFSKKKAIVTDEEARQQIQLQEEQLRKLHDRACSRIKPWPRELQIDDYNFRSWAIAASKNCLTAGAKYEYARESQKLRGLLALMNPKRQRETWEMVRAAIVNGERPDPNDPLARATPLPCSFEDLDEYQAERALGGFLFCLADVAEYLADNISFSELFRTKRDELENAFGGLDKLARVTREFRHFLPILDPVDVATQSEANHATVEETISDDEKRLVVGNTASEVMAIKIRWRFTDSEIAGALRKLVPAARPKTSKPVHGKKGSRRDSPRSALDCLSAMRLASYLPKPAPVTPGRLAAWMAGDSPELDQSAIGLFNAVRLGGRGNCIAESNFDTLIVEARRLFTKEFPFGETAANALTLAKRPL